MNIEVIWAAKAKEQLKKLETITAHRILNKIKELSKNFTFANIKKIHKRSEYRLRLGDYRIIFEIKDKKIMILRIGHRKNIYNR